METFTFHYHSPTTAYPESGDRMQFGGGYVFTAAPTAPDQRVITLAFASGTMRNYWDSVLEAPDILTDPERNFYALELFYQAHKMWKSFLYLHPQYGELTVRFNKPLTTPKVLPNKPGVLDGFSLEFLEQP